MSFDSMAMAAVAAEIRDCVGGQVQQVHQPEAETVVLTLRAGGRNHLLLLSAHARYGRVHFINGKFPHPETPPTFCMLLRKYLKGAYLAEARQIDFDRVLHLQFRYGETSVRLILEVMGKHSNLILVNAEGQVLDAIKRVGARESRVRPMLPGLPYTPPPTGGKADPGEATAELLRPFLATGETAADCLRAQFPLGPMALETVLARCGLRGDSPAEAADPECLARALRAVSDAAGYTPALVTDSRGVPSGISLLPETPLPAGSTRQERPSASEALEEYYTYFIAHEAVEGRRRELLRALTDAAKFARRRIQEAEEGTEAARTAPELEHQATLLLSNMQRVRRGAASLTVTDFYDPEQREISLALDPALSPQEQAARWFKRARKLVDAVPHLERQWEEEHQRLEAMERLRPALEAARTGEEIEALREQMRELGALREHIQAPTGPRMEKGPGVQRRSIGNFEVLLGRNATENDYLTTRIAAPDDWWLHARGVTSAHVVIRTGKHPERVPPEVLREAARLCALHSASKHSRMVPVDYTLRKYVIRRRGAALGSVLYTHEKTLNVEPGLE